MLYEIASSHLARRTFVGNLYKQVKDPNLVGALSGHKEGSKAFARYRTIDDEMKQQLVDLLKGDDCVRSAVGMQRTLARNHKSH